MSKDFLKSVYYQGLSLIGADHWRMKKLRSKRKIAVLNLHRVSPHENPFWPPLHPDIFEKLLKFLRHNFVVRRFDELGDVEHEDKPVAVLSFDDGYFDYIEYALPLLDQYEMQANMNIIPTCSETGIPIWNVQLYDFLNNAGRKLINELDLPGFDVKLADDSRESKIAYGLRISRHLNRPRREREEIWSEIDQVLAKLDTTGTRLMSVDDIKGISPRTEIGVHSYTHESMAFEETEFFESDFRRCQEYFFNRLELPLTIYAFPNGSYRNEQVEFLRRNEIKQILLVDETFADLNTDVYTRLTVYGGSELEVRCKSLGF